MQAILKSTAKWSIVVFCLFHMTAVALYTIPETTKDPLTLFVRTNITPVIRPYLFLTSQWQRWNLFSPDPLRRITTYTLEKETATGWESVPNFGYPRMSPFKHIDYFKILNALDNDREKLMPVRTAFLQSFCKEAGVMQGVHVRLHASSVVLSKNPKEPPTEPVPDPVTVIPCP